MNENIDLTKILKDCPTGTKLYSSVHGEVEFERIETTTSRHLHVVIELKDFLLERINFNGKLYNSYDGECILFPSKDQRDWSKFTAPWYNRQIEQKFQVGQCITDGYISGQIIEDDCHCYKVLDFTGDNIIIPFTLQDNYHLWTIQDAKDGDVLALSWLEDKNLFEKIVIFKKYHNEGVNGLYSMPCVEGYGSTFMNGKMLFTDEKVPYFSKTWTCNLHPATKEQRDRLFQRIKEAGYEWNVETKTLEKRLKYKFNHKTLKPFDKVLIRDSSKGQWICALYSHERKENENTIFKYITTAGSYICCIPYNDDTKHLVGTTDEAPEYYRYWED